MSSNESPQPIPQPPGDIPPDYIHATIITCERVIVEKETNNTNIIGAFTGLVVKYGTKEGRKGLEDTEFLPFPSGFLFLRLLSAGTQTYPWTIYCRILSINDTLIPNAVVPISTGKVDVRPSPGLIGLADAPIPFLGHGFKLTPERRALIAPDGSFELTVRYEVWTDQTFLVAHHIKIKYNAIGSEENANTSNSQNASEIP